MKYYYKLGIHPEHIASGLHLANENFEKIRGILRNGEKIDHDILYFVANKEVDWRNTLTHMDLIKAQKPIISEKAYCVLKPFIKSDTQVIPCKIAYKDNIYDNFYLLIAMTPISLVDAQNSIFDVTPDEKEKKIDAMITSIEFYDEDMERKTYLLLQNKEHIFYDILLPSPTIVSKKIYEEIQKNKLKMSCNELYGEDPWFGMHDDHYKFDESPELRIFLKRKLRKASNYDLLKSMFNCM